jgi:hypothetical protein
MFGFGAFGESAFGEVPDPIYRISAAHTKEGKERLRAYYEALGRFVDKFSRVEAAMTLTLWHYAKTPPEVSKVIFTSDKVDSCITKIKQVAKVYEVDTALQNDLEVVFQQLGIINGVRNDVLHYGAAFVAEGKGIVSDALKAKGEPYVFPISPTALDQMTADLDKIIAHLKTVHLGDHADYTILGNPVHSPWRYKHPVPPRTPSKKVPDAPAKRRGPKRPRQPQSSQK